MVFEGLELSTQRKHLHNKLRVTLRLVRVFSEPNKLKIRLGCQIYNAL